MSGTALPGTYSPMYYIETLLGLKEITEQESRQLCRVKRGNRQMTWQMWVITFFVISATCNLINIVYCLSRRKR